VNYFDALSDPLGSEPLETQVNRFLVSQAVMLALIGVPGIYFHSLFGSRGWPEGVQKTGHNRTINRQKLRRTMLEEELDDPAHLRQRVFRGFAALLRARSAHPAFNPTGEQRVLDCDKTVFGLERFDPVSGDRVFCLHNVSNLPQAVQASSLTQSAKTPATMLDIAANQRHTLQNGRIDLAPYQVLWLSSV
jgi:hypothetical protein